MSELLKRVLFAIPAAILFIAALWYGSWYFWVLVLIILAFTQFELIRLFKKTGTPSNTLFSYLIAAWVFSYPINPLANETGLIILLLFITVQTLDSKSGSLHKLSSTFFAGLYAPIGFTCLVLIRNSGTQEQGFALALALILMIWGADAFAYFGGKTFGKTKLAPAISPNKTVEGFVFGFIGCFVGLALSIYTLPFESPLTLLNGAPLVLLVGVFGPVGDLLESKIKRKAGVKDSSTILPGHGGFFDRFDALIPASIAMFTYIEILKHLNYVSL
ncbi:MAG: phosphatidate cytidylyltransferase [Balneolaceae bacterium]